MPSLIVPTLSRPRQRHARPSLLALAALAAGAIGMSSAARAQSLLELYDAARGYDAAYQSARAQAESVVFRAEQSRALKRPSVNGTASWAAPCIASRTSSATAEAESWGLSMSNSS